jgi:hypothetical protein
MEGDHISQMRRQRNLAAVAAVLLLGGSLGTAWPRFISRQQQRKLVDGEIIDLQGKIVDCQELIANEQARVLKAQHELRVFLQQSR